MNSKRFGPAIPGIETDGHGNVVPEGTAESAREALYHLREDEDADDDYVDDENVPRAWNRYTLSERAQQRASFDNNATMLADIIDSNLRKSAKQHRSELQKPAQQGFKGTLNKLPGMKLKPSPEEKKLRTKQYEERVQRIHDQAIKRTQREVLTADLDIMMPEDADDRLCPAVGVGSQKGGSGKTTTIVSLAEFFSRTLAHRQRKKYGKSVPIKPAVIADLNPDKGTIVSRVPDTVNKRGSKLNTLQLGQLCQQHEVDDPNFDAMDYTFPTKWQYLRAIPNPVDKSDRVKMTRGKIEAIYDHIADKAAMFFMDNGTRIDSPQSLSSVNLSNAFVLVIDAGSDANFVVGEVRDYHAMASEHTSFKGISERMVVAIIVKADSDAQRKNARQLREKLNADNVSSVIVPFEKKLANNEEIIFNDLSVEYRSAIAALAHHILSSLNKSE